MSEGQTCLNCGGPGPSYRCLACRMHDWEDYQRERQEYEAGGEKHPRDRTQMEKLAGVKAVVERRTR